ncbi:DUF4229 domain-containing protein [Micromonospora sp. HM5-17]|jgi:hypothetical protein|uniref:DUF4229 domain-containing protein n=1 Tax=Micromonospora sp. HM5-17 TaxID=2487710 RepID=UPI000F49F450|nr:DUF4229 domain-containing protein [Micromonospora sp. HM5-17]ROT34355.1 DUF4229 domain-containing protein [Micromonospora sp. HM5-17]
MSPAVKYTLGRIGLFVAVFLPLWPVEMNVFLKLILALAFSAALSFFLLRGWRDEMARQLADAAERRRAEKDRLRAALAGEDGVTGGDGPAGQKPVEQKPTDGSADPR